MSDPIRIDYGDYDSDYRVSETDVAGFMLCRTGPVPSPISPECESLDIDSNGLLDLPDFARLQNCYSGDFPADPLCGG